MQFKKNTVQYTEAARSDIKEKKMYILQTFRYRAYGENFSRKMKEAEERLKNLPVLPTATDFTYRGYDIYLLVHKTYLFLFIADGSLITVLRVFENGMNWKRILERWLRQN